MPDSDQGFLTFGAVVCHVANLMEMEEEGVLSPVRYKKLVQALNRV